MRLLEKLFWDLAKVVDKTDGGVSLQRVIDAEYVNIALVEEMVVNVGTFNSSVPLLSEAKYEINPLVEVG